MTRRRRRRRGYREGMKIVHSRLRVQYPILRLVNFFNEFHHTSYPNDAQDIHCWATRELNALTGEEKMSVRYI